MYVQTPWIGLCAAQNTRKCIILPHKYNANMCRVIRTRTHTHTHTLWFSTSTFQAHDFAVLFQKYEINLLFEYAD